MEIESLKLVYFSPTGTTKKIIEGIVRGINHSSVEQVDITKPKNRKLQIETTENELLIIGAPVYFGRVQTTAIEWLHTIKAHNTPAVCVVVYGNREYEDALLELKETMVSRGCIPIACASFIGEHSLSNSETPIAAGRPDSNDLLTAEAFGEKVKYKIISIPSVSVITDIRVPGKYPYVDKIDIKQMLNCIDFIAVDSNCTQCGDCAQHCPVSAIVCENSTSVDKNKCIICHACIKNCPVNALTIKNDIIKNIAIRLSETLQVRKEPEVFW
ncbi:MAG: 4Fe-4S binding protein [Syntrophobacteraceae bacterium]